MEKMQVFCATRQMNNKIFTLNFCGCEQNTKYYNLESFYTTNSVFFIFQQKRFFNL